VIRVAVAGNPNTGKTSLFNALTGARQHVGNYAGVTVEKKEGTCTRNGETFHIADLPGAYSLSAFSPEEQIAEQEILFGKFDVIIVTADAGNLSRSLVILAQIMMTGATCVLCLNMWDEAEASGRRLDLALMESLLGLKVVTTVGHRGIGVEKLLDAVVVQAAKPPSAPKVVLGDRLDNAVSAVKRLMISAEGDDDSRLGRSALMLIASDQRAVEKYSKINGNDRAIEEANRRRARIESETGLDIETVLTEAFFGFVDGLLREVTIEEAGIDMRKTSDRIDRVLAHRVLGLPFFALAMYGVFYVTFTLGEAPMKWIEGGFSWLGTLIASLWSEGSSSPLKSLIVDGIIGGVGGVVVFLPNILLLFLGLALLEDTGYMARAAFLVDRLMHRFGLHGKSFLPLLTGFGCSIPGIMACRTLENHRDRLTTMLVLPLMSCGARLPIWMLLIPAFFPPMWRAPMLFIIYFIGIIAALALALLLRRTVLKSEDAPFVMELPPYRMPTLKAVVMKMVERSKLYLMKAGTVILAVSILMWVAASYPKPDSAAINAIRENAAKNGMSEQEIDAASESYSLANSFAGKIGRSLEPVLSPLGFDWKIACGLVGAFAAKEVFVAQMGVVYSMGKTDETSTPLRDALRRDYSPLVGLSMILFLLIGTPCMATFAVMRRESGSSKWAAAQFFGLTILAWTVSFIVFQMGSLLGF
jgi:ferrous iron transport protein B